MLITDRSDFKLHVKIDECPFPQEMKNIQFVREEYNDKGELVNDSTYQFFLTKDEVVRLAKCFQ